MSDSGISLVGVTPPAYDPSQGVTYPVTYSSPPVSNPVYSQPSTPIDWAGISNAVQTGVKAYQQVALTQANIKLAQQGQPPIGAGYIPGYGSGVQASVVSNIPPWVWIAGGLAIVFMVSKK